MAKAEALRSEQLAVAGAAVDLLVRAVARDHRIQRPVALGTIEALLVPHGALGQLLLGGKHHSTAPRTTLAGGRFDAGRVVDHHRLLGGHLFLAGKGRRLVEKVT